MNRRFPPLIFAAFLLLCVPPALAWNAAGHRLVAAIAWRDLGTQSRREAARLLAAHPDAAAWGKKIRPGEDPALGLFTEASTWADGIRHDPRFYDEGQEMPTPGIAGYPDMARRRHWHYVNLPIGEAGQPSADGEIDRRIAPLAADVGDRRLSDAARAYALTWLIHLIGDIHQPLHVATHHDGHGHDDGGGNGLLVLDAGNPRYPRTNLHAWWDELPGPPWLRGPRLLATAERLAERTPADQVEQGDVAAWRDESYALAATLAYPDAGAKTDGDRVVLDDAYRDAARAISQQRVAAAGHRLGRLLERLLGPGESALRRGRAPANGRSAPRSPGE